MKQQKARTAFHRRLSAIQASIDNFGSEPVPGKDHTDRIIAIEKQLAEINEWKKELTINLEALNKRQSSILERLYTLDNTWTIKGVVTGGNNKPIPGVGISAMDQDEVEFVKKRFAERTQIGVEEVDLWKIADHSDFLGMDISDRNGQFRITYNSDDFQDFHQHCELYPNLVLSIFQRAGRLGKPSFQTFELNRPADRTEILRIRITQKGDISIYDKNDIKLK